MDLLLCRAHFVRLAEVRLEKSPLLFNELLFYQGTVQGERRKDRQKKRWEDNISEWPGLGLSEALRKAEDREGWGKVVARSSLMPKPSFRQQDE